MGFDVDDDDLNLVDDVYIDTRYPGGVGLLPSGFPAKEEAVKVLGIAEDIHNKVTGFVDGYGP